MLSKSLIKLLSNKNNNDNKQTLSEINTNTINNQFDLNNLSSSKNYVISNLFTRPQWSV